MCYQLDGAEIVMFVCVCAWQVIKERPTSDVLVTTVIYRADEFGRVKTEQYTQTRLSGGEITLDYSEHYDDTRRHRNAEPAADSRDDVDDDDDDDVASENNDIQTDAEEKEVLTEEKKRGFVWCSFYPVWALECCRRSPPHFLAECRKKRLNQASFILLCFIYIFYSPKKVAITT